MHYSWYRICGMVCELKFWTFLEKKCLTKVLYNNNENVEIKNAHIFHIYNNFDLYILGDPATFCLMLFKKYIIHILKYFLSDLCKSI